MSGPKHERGPFYWSADSEYCKHGTEPDWNANGDTWDLWSDRHPASDDGRICLDAFAGEACLTCSSEEVDMIPWDDCRIRVRIRPKGGMVPNPDTDH
ncbi:hypothetical protein ABT282_08485 [Streptomyces sp. NPDC000927]|uniref:hypothetical protein n=1 Tax=Streptomyces sp. NPDC000927 TaxID=3154371 RepID=UPI0033205755